MLAYIPAPWILWVIYNLFNIPSYTHYSTTSEENFIPIHQMVNHVVFGGQNSLFNLGKL